MARKRMISPDIWADKRVGSMSILARYVFISLISLADDEGRGDGSPETLLMRVFASSRDRKEINIDKITKACDEIAEHLAVRFYSVDGKDDTYYQIENWSKWQYIDKPTKSIIPKYGNSPTTSLPLGECSPTTTIAIDDDYAPNIKEVKLKEVNINKDNICRFANTDLFEILWKEYPKRAGSSKQKALTSFEKLKCDDVLLDKILKSITILKDSKAWLDGYVPHLATFLNQKRWESVIDDEPKVIVGEKVDIEALVNEYEKSKGANK